MHLQAIEHQELLAGIIASAVVNYGFCHPDEYVSPEAFMPSVLAKRARNPQVNLESIRLAFQTLEKAGKVRRITD